MREKLKDIILDVSRIRPASDYKWVSQATGETWGVERKSVDDFIGSFNAGRLTEQLRGLLDTKDIQVPVLLVEGTFSQTEGGNLLTARRNKGIQLLHFKYSLVQDIYLEAQMLGVFLQFSTNLNDSANRIRQLYNWSHRDEHNLLTNRRRRHMEFGTRLTLQEQFIANLPGVGGDMAQTLLGQFRTPWNVLQLFAGKGGIDFLQNEVKGLGPGKIKAVRKLLGFDD